MIAPVTDAALMRFLEAEAPLLQAKLLELRTEAEAWLTYTTASFAHYTQHTVKHSDEIIRQISNLLFRGNDPTLPVVALSPIEAYTCCATAYLHDAGMVVSDEEKLRILRSDAWNEWLAADTHAAARHAEIEELRAADGAEADVNQFAADRQLRLLISEYVRQFHHERSSRFIQAHQSSLGRFAFDDPLLARTISDCCLAHGLRHFELDDGERYPEQRDVLGDKINVRFVALLVRLGDLLDLSADRACPLLLNAAAPLPAESLAHWGQYQRIVHRETDPERIELVAECETGTEHRLLQDWCQWIVDEVQAAERLMIRSARHNDWRPPVATLGDAGSTIVIRPAPGASYIPAAWQLQIDSEQVVDRLINDLYGSPLAFVRELLQNALDASRCQMYRDMRLASHDPPEYPNQAPDSWLEKYPVSVSRSRVTRFNELSQSDEARDVITVEDCGLGMTEDVILKYLLQVGRSFYTTDDFRRSYAFAPTSRFGVGFLSVFAASDEITVDTLAADAEPGSGLRLTLTGPRSYVLTERSSRSQSGTRVEIVLRPSVSVEDMRKLITDMCTMVEFPVLIDDDGRSFEVRREVPEDLCYEVDDISEAGARMGVKAFPVAADGVFGAVYVFYHVDSSARESWTRAAWSQTTYPTVHPLARAPSLPGDMKAFHGISYWAGGYRHYETSPVARLDFRRPVDTLPLARAPAALIARSRVPLDEAAVQAVLETALRKHLDDSPLASGSFSWLYKQALMDRFPIVGFWDVEPATLRIFDEGHETLVSVAQLTEQPIISVVIDSPVLKTFMFPPDAEVTWPSDISGLTESDLDQCSQLARKAVFADRAPVRMSRLDDDFAAVEWQRGAEPVRLIDHSGQVADVVELPDDDVVGVRTHKSRDNVYDHVLLNSEHPFVVWLQQVQEACSEKREGLTNATWDALQRLVSRPLWYMGHHVEDLNRYLARWNDAGLPHELAPPTTELPAQAFR